MFCVRRPTTIEFEDKDIPKPDMTYESPEWDPSDPDWATQEASTMDSRGRVHDLDNVIAGGRRFINLVSTSAQSADFTSDEYLHARLRLPSGPRSVLAAVDRPTGAVGSLHISHDDEMCVRGPILLAGAVVGPDAETIRPFAPSFIVDRAAVWEKLA